MNRDFRPPTHERLLKYATSKVCEKLGLLLTRYHGHPIIRDKVGYIAIPLTDGYQSFYLMARKTLFHGHVTSIEKSIVLEAIENDMRIIQYVDECPPKGLQGWFIFDPRKIMASCKGIGSFRGEKEYLDFDAFELDEKYAVRFAL